VSPKQKQTRLTLRMTDHMKKLKQLEKNKQNFDDDLRNRSDRIRELTSQMSQKAKLDQDLETEKEKVEEFQGELEDAKENVDAKRQEYKKIAPDRAKRAKSLAEKFLKLHEKDERLAELVMKKAECQAIIHALSSMHSEFEAEEQQLLAEVTATEARYSEALTEVRAAFVSYLL
jgi:chromosome segregation ATPase